MSSLTRFVLSVSTISFAFLIVVTSVADAQVPDATYFIEPPILGEIGAPVSSVHRITTSTPGFTGFGGAFCIDPTILSPLAIEPGDGLGPSSQIFFFDAYIDVDGVGVGCILSGTGTVTLPVGSGIELTVCQFQTIAGTSGEQVSIEFCQLENNSGTSVITYFNWLYYQGGDFFPELIVGFPQFIRADGNIDGMIDSTVPVSTREQFAIISGRPSVDVDVATSTPKTRTCGLRCRFCLDNSLHTGGWNRVPPFVRKTNSVFYPLAKRNRTRVSVRVSKPYITERNS